VRGGTDYILRREPNGPIHSFRTGIKVSVKIKMNNLRCTSNRLMEINNILPTDRMEACYVFVFVSTVSKAKQGKCIYVAQFNNQVI